MATIAEALAIGLSHHQTGNLQQAEQVYRQILDRAPDHAEALYFLGLIAHQLGKHDVAVEYFTRSISLDNHQAVSHLNLGVAYWALGRTAEAVACYERAIELKPDFVKAHYNLGVARKEQRRFDEAIDCCRRALALRPDLAEAYNLLGIVLAEQGRLDESSRCYRRALELRPDYGDAYIHLGIALIRQGQLDEAGRCLERALALNRDSAEVWTNLGLLRVDQGRLHDAVACYQRAIELNPGSADGYFNLGNARRDEGRLDEAVACFQRVIDIAPGRGDAHWNRSLIWLLKGDFERGWREYEWRWESGECPRRDQFSEPPWDGRPLLGQSILLYDEQGLGDAIQFIRYAHLVKQRASRVVVECHRGLIGLLANCRGIDELIPRGGILPPFDVHCPLLSLPGIFQTTLETIPAEVPYLFVEQALVDCWRQELARHRGFRAGIVWQGNRRFKGDGSRSIPLLEFAPLAEVPGVTLISLQKGFGEEQLDALGGRFSVSDAGDFGEYSGTDRAAILLNLDLLITSDTAMGHLAGALGVPVWVALPFVPDWRWFLDREDSPWYPTMRLFRQTAPGDWGGVFRRIKAGLAKRVAQA